MVSVGEETGVPGENPRCQVGIINPTDLTDGSDQQLREAIIVPKPNRLTTWPARRPLSEWGKPGSLALRWPPIQVPTRPDVA